ncbi:hypothetical protein Ancab_021185 [Ancistrocladus abbreviatus]
MAPRKQLATRGGGIKGKSLHNVLGNGKSMESSTHEDIEVAQLIWREMHSKHQHESHDQQPQGLEVIAIEISGQPQPQPTEVASQQVQQPQPQIQSTPQWLATQQQ